MKTGQNASAPVKKPMSWIASSAGLCKIPKGVQMQLRRYQWLYLIIVGLVCAPAVLLPGSLRELRTGSHVRGSVPSDLG